MASTRSTLNEAQTRQQLIDQQLARAGWGMAERRMLEEYPLSIAEAEPDYGQQPQEFADYVLLGRDGKPLALSKLNAPAEMPSPEKDKRQIMPIEYATTSGSIPSYS
jgi:type I site-specific restriction endonuclease